MLASLRQHLISAAAKLLAQKVAVSLASLGSLIVAVALSWQSYLAPLMSDQTGVLALRITLLAVIAVLLAIGSFFWFRPKLKTLPFGVHQDTKTGAYFCSRCYLKDKKHYPLETTANGWKCSVCGQWKQYPNNPVVPLPTKHFWNDKP